MMKLMNKIAIVTGASSGIGKAGAILLAKEGADILITYNTNEEGAIDTKKKINELGKRCEILKIDFNDIKNIKSIIDKTMEKYGAIDILINNAGISYFKDFLEDSLEDFDYLLNVNLKSIFILSKFAAKEMIKRTGGCIVNITSISGISLNEPNLVSYCTSKAAANMLTRGMAKDLAKYNIRVNAILPGPVIVPRAYEISGIETINSMIERTPMKRVGQPEEIGKMIVFLSTDDSSFMTGSLVVMDGGMTL